MNRFSPYIIILAVVAAAIFPIVYWGIPDSVDLMQHLRFADLYREGILSGSLTPGWSANDNYGFGSIGIRYYPPLAYYVLALTQLSTGSWFDSFWLTTFGWTLLGSTGVYLWVKEWATRTQALMAALMYIVVPYHTFQLYQAVLYAEFAAAGILPFCFLFLLRICRGSRWLDVLLFSVAYSSLILTHIPTTIIASISLAVYGLIIIDWKRLYITGSQIAVALVVGLLASAFHLVRAVPELDWVIHNSPQYFAKGIYDYRRYLFPTYLSPSTGKNFQSILSNFDILIILTLLVFIPSILAYLARSKKISSPGKRGAKLEIAAFVTGAVAILMMTIVSSVIWEHVSVLQKVQFPWRWLVIASLMGSVVFALALSRLGSLERLSKRWIVYPAIALVLALTLFDITQNIIPSAPVPRDVFDQKVANMYDEEACECWWPIWAKREAFDRRTLVDAGIRDVSINEWQDESREFSIAAGQVQDVRIATFFHPYWKAVVNGERVPVEHDDTGAILISAPVVVSDIRLFFEEPGYLYISKLVSLLTWIGIGGLLVVALYARRKGGYVQI